jgi:hypothetical protein
MIGLYVFYYTEVSSTRIEGSFFSVAITTPFEAAQKNEEKHKIWEWRRERGRTNKNQNAKEAIERKKKKRRRKRKYAQSTK